MLRAIFQLKRPVRQDFLGALYRLTEGNPFFVEEVLKSLLAAGDIYFTKGGGTASHWPSCIFPRVSPMPSGNARAA